MPRPSSEPLEHDGPANLARPLAESTNAIGRSLSGRSHALLAPLLGRAPAALAADESNRSPRASLRPRADLPPRLPINLSEVRRAPSDEYESEPDSIASPLFPLSRNSTETTRTQGSDRGRHIDYATGAAQAPFRSPHTFATMGALVSYALLNGTTVASVQNENPPAVIGLVAALTMNVPRVIGEMLHCAVMDKSHELDRTMYVRVVGAAVTGALTSMAQNHPEALGFDAERGAAYLLKAIGWSAFASTIVDSTVNAVLRTLGKKSLVYAQHNPTREGLADPTLRLCSLDYLGAQAWSLIETMTGKLGRHASMGRPGEEEFAALAMRPVGPRTIMQSGTVSPLLLRDQEQSETAPFNSPQTYVWVGAAIAYATINSVMAHYSQNNLPNLLSMLYNLTGFLPVMIGDLLHKASSNEAFTLDKTMSTKIIAVAVIGSLMSAANRHPEAMGLSDENKVAYMAAVVTWTTLSTLIVEVTANFAQRKTMGTKTVYKEPSPEALGDSSRYWFSGDFVVSRARALIEKWWAPRTVYSALYDPV